MTPVLFVVAAGLAAAGRYAVGRRLVAWRALLVVNVAGSLLLGWVAEADLDRRWEVVVGVGLCGTLTTYSSFALEVRALGGRTGALYALTTVVACLLAAAVGIALT